MSRPNNTIGALNSARRQASLQRAEWLMLILDRVVTPDDLIREAGVEKALQKVSLRQLLMAQPGWGRQRTGRTLQDLLSVCGAPAGTHTTVGWLLDPRAGGRRHEAWIDVTGTVKPQWPGFPYTRSSFV